MKENILGEPIQTTNFDKIINGYKYIINNLLIKAVNNDLGGLDININEYKILIIAVYVDAP
ncbi:MAG TPA: hypothetical protein GX709_04465 [Clostridiales bacterium]|nr:hypothetical protein [Clostridiales bacterium]